MSKHESTALEYYEAGQMSVYARLIRERRMTVDTVAEMTSREFAQQANALSRSRQCIDGPWIFMEINRKSKMVKMHDESEEKENENLI